MKINSLHILLSECTNALNNNVEFNMTHTLDYYKLKHLYQRNTVECTKHSIFNILYGIFVWCANTLNWLNII